MIIFTFCLIGIAIFLSFITYHALQMQNLLKQCEMLQKKIDTKTEIEEIYISDQDYKQLKETLDNPPEPNLKLIKLMNDKKE